MGMALSSPLSRSASAPPATSAAGRQWSIRACDFPYGLPPNYRFALRSSCDLSPPSTFISWHRLSTLLRLSVVMKVLLELSLDISKFEDSHIYSTWGTNVCICCVSCVQTLMPWSVCRLGPWGMEYYGPSRQQQPGESGSAVGSLARAGHAGLLGKPGSLAGQPAAPAPRGPALRGGSLAPEQQQLQYGASPPGRPCSCVHIAFQEHHCLIFSISSLLIGSKVAKVGCLPGLPCLPRGGGDSDHQIHS